MSNQISDLDINNKSAVLSTLKGNSDIFKHLPESLRDDFDVVMVAVKFITI
jgi:hypothetical protein